MPTLILPLDQLRVGDIPLAFQLHADGPVFDLYNSEEHPIHAIDRYGHAAYFGMDRVNNRSTLYTVRRTEATITGRTSYGYDQGVSWSGDDALATTNSTYRDMFHALQHVMNQSMPEFMPSATLAEARVPCENCGKLLHPKLTSGNGYRHGC